MALAYGHYSTAVQTAATTIWYTVTLTGGELNAHKYHDVARCVPPDKLYVVESEDFLSATAECSAWPIPQTPYCMPAESDPPFG